MVKQSLVDVNQLNHMLDQRSLRYTLNGVFIHNLALNITLVSNVPISGLFLGCKSKNLKKITRIVTFEE